MTTTVASGKPSHHASAPRRPWPWSPWPRPCCSWRSRRSTGGHPAGQRDLPRCRRGWRVVRRVPTRGGPSCRCCPRRGRAGRLRGGDGLEPERSRARRRARARRSVGGGSGLRAHPGASAGDTERAPRARHPVLLMNPRSGGGKVERFGLVDLCRQRGIEPYVLRPGDDLRQVAEDAVARGADLLGMAGGDGSLAIVATVVSGHGIPFVVVPAGTRNHFALDLGLDRADVPGALDAYDDGVDTRWTWPRSTAASSSTTRRWACTPRSSSRRTTATPRSRRLPRCCQTCWGRGRSRSTCTTTCRPARRRPRASCCWCPTTPTTWRTCVAGAPASASTAACLASSRCESMEQPTLRSLPRWKPRARSGASPAGRSGRRPSSWSDRPGRWRSASTGRPWSSSHRSASPSGRAL